MEEYWLNAALMIRAHDAEHAKEQLDAVLQGWARLTAQSDCGLSMYDRTGMADEETK